MELLSRNFLRPILLLSAVFLTSRPADSQEPMDHSQMQHHQVDGIQRTTGFRSTEGGHY